MEIIADVIHKGNANSRPHAHISV